AIELKRGPQGQLNAIQDSAGRVFQIASDFAGRITAIDALHPDREGETLRLVSYAYDAAGDLIGVPDARGTSCPYRYEHRLMVQDRRRGGLLFHFVWDNPALGHAARCVDTWGDSPGGRRGLLRARLTYDLEARATVVVNGRGAASRYRWNELHLVDEEIDP